MICLGLSGQHQVIIFMDIHYTARTILLELKAKVEAGAKTAYMATHTAANI